MRGVPLNEVTALDAGLTLLLHVERHWPGASEFLRYTVEHVEAGGPI